MASSFKHSLKRFGSTSHSVINGVLGDKLDNTPFGIKMGFYFRNQPVNIHPKSLLHYEGGYDKKITSKVCILIHGLSNNESTWSFKDKSDYGGMLSQAKGFTPFYLRYNTGLHISDNGKNLSELLVDFCDNYPLPIDEICIIAHSMGGLVVHSATHIATINEYSWTKKLSTVFLLATPHLGSFLEQFANMTTNILDRVPNWPTRLVGRAINLRSSGIKDLRYGYTKEEDWKEQAQDSLWTNTKNPVSKLEDVHYFVMSGRLTKKEKHWLGNIMGDVLVSKKSAVAQTGDQMGYNFGQENHYEFPKTNHAKFTSNMDVFDKILEVLSK